MIDILNKITPKSKYYIYDLGQNLLQAYTVIDGIEGNPALLLRSHTNKGYSLKGQEAMNTSLVVTFSAGLSAVFVLVILLHFIIVSPVKRLISHFTEIGRSADTSVRLSMSRRDEIGRLAREFDHMVERLNP